MKPFSHRHQRHLIFLLFSSMVASFCCVCGADNLGLRGSVIAPAKGPDSYSAKDIRLSFLRFPSRCMAGSDCEITIRLSANDASLGSLDCRVDWGDSNKELINLRDKGRLGPGSKQLLGLSHEYKQEGDFNITVLAVSPLDDKPSASINKKIKVGFKAPVLGLRRETRRRGAGGQIFHVKAAAGSYPLGSWELDFGDKTNKSASGEINAKLIHFYWKKGHYRIVLKAIDSAGNKFTKICLLRIANDGSLKDAEKFFRKNGVIRGPRQQPAARGSSIKPRRGPAYFSSQDYITPEQTSKHQEALSHRESDDKFETVTEVLEPDKPSAYVLAIRNLIVPSEFHIGEKASIDVVVKNLSNREIQGCYVSLDTGDIFKARKDISLKLRAKTRVRFFWIPGKRGGQEITVELQCPQAIAIENGRISKPITVLE